MPSVQMTRVAGTDELEVALAAVREAARLCQRVQRTLGYGVLTKGDRSPVTVADYGSQALICRALRAALPHDPIVAEEDAEHLRSSNGHAVAGEVARHVQAVRPGATEDEVLSWIDEGSGTLSDERFWILDPIDGTKGFLGQRQYAIALALLDRGQVRLGVLGCPNLAGGALFAAARGKGATFQRLSEPATGVRMRVSRMRDLAGARRCESVESGHSAHGIGHRLAACLGIRSEPVRMDSQAKYAVVAGGQAELYLRLPISRSYREKIWDHAAGALLLTEAGGQVTDVCGQPLDFSCGTTLSRNRGIVATNGIMHAKVIEALTEMCDDA